MKNLKSLCLMGILAASAVACGDGSARKSGKKLSQINPALMGTWKTPCTSVDGVFDVAYVKQEYSFSPIGDFTKKQTYYKDSDCSVKLLSYEAEGGVADLDVRSDKKVRDVNFTVTGQNVTVHDETAVKLLNKVSLCGKDDWRPDTKVSLEGRQCAGYAFDNGSVIYDLYKKDGDTMYFGHTTWFKSGKKADERPNVLDEETAYNKK